MTQLPIRQLPRNEVIVLETIRRAGHLVTRIKELGEGDIEYADTFEPTERCQRELGISGDELLTCLHALQDRGLIVATVTVHPTSATEYVCHWTALWRRRRTPQEDGSHDAVVDCAAASRRARAQQRRPRARGAA